MPDEEETRLLAALKDSHWLSRAASDAVTRPMHSVIIGSAAHRKLIEADRAACERYQTARAALLAWRRRKAKAVGA